MKVLIILAFLAAAAHAGTSIATIDLLVVTDNQALCALPWTLAGSPSRPQRLVFWNGLAASDAILAESSVATITRNTTLLLPSDSTTVYVQPRSYQASALEAQIQQHYGRNLPMYALMLGLYLFNVYFQ
jgi:hypothetical protein